MFMGPYSKGAIYLVVLLIPYFKRCIYMFAYLELFVYWWLYRPNYDLVYVLILNRFMLMFL